MKPTKPTYRRVRSDAFSQQHNSIRTVPAILDKALLHLPGVESFRNYEWTAAAEPPNLAALLRGALSTEAVRS